MKASDRGILVGLAVVALAIAFYVMVLGPKRNDAAELGSQIDELHASISQQQQVASFAEQARKHFPRYYGRLVVLGKAVPEQADTGSMLVQLNSIASRTGVDFRAIALSQGASGTGTSTSTSAAQSSASTADSASSAGSSGTGTATSPTATTPSTGTSTTPSSDTSTSSSTTSSSSTLVPATEGAAATQPIGAVVGAAGLSTLPYNLTFTGSFFDVGNFIGGIDGLVKPQGTSEVSANGRLVTVDGFALQLHDPNSPILDASFAVTTYVDPAEQGLTAGASPGGPAPVDPTQPQTQPASSGVAQ
ncbi:MAG: hypothetical protein WB771_14935 [Solirubrobacterales bacterium]